MGVTSTQQQHQGRLVLHRVSHQAARWSSFAVLDCDSAAASTKPSSVSLNSPVAVGTMWPPDG